MSLLDDWLLSKNDAVYDKIKSYDERRTSLLREDFVQVSDRAIRFKPGAVTRQSKNMKVDEKRSKKTQLCCTCMN